MNAAVTVGIGKAAGAVLLIGPEVPIRDQLRSVKRKEVEVPPGVDVVEVWSRNTGVLKRRKIKSAAEPQVPVVTTNEDSTGDAPEAPDEDSPVAGVPQKKRATRKKET